MTVLIGQELLLIILAVIFGALLGCALRAFLASQPGQDLANRAEALYDPAAAAARRASEEFPLSAAEEGNRATDADAASLSSVSLTGAPVPDGREEPLPQEQSVIPVEVVATVIDEEKPKGAKPKKGGPVDTSVDPTLVAEGMAGEGLVDAPSDTDQPEGVKPKALESPRDGKADDLKKIKGVGKVIEGKLNNLGIYHFDQIARWTDAEATWVSSILDFKGRIERENWIAQAREIIGPDAIPVDIDEADEDAVAAAGAVPVEVVEAEAEPVDVDAEEEKIEQVLATLPEGASAKEKAEAVGSKPALLSGPRDGKPDDLKQIRGIGRVIETKLNDLGIYHFDQIADWSREEAHYVSTFLSFKGRIDRENWIAQAKLLASGQATAFSIRVSKGQVESSRG
ncbi:Predicted 5' DNA nuclease, flap endonuclease-1-like, helix-3-turn-helix (H3TH) domain [Cohaesibacter marisflavi]|uniref:Predicted 5' DNA nuclease, flap endonuclease-1-like, helix-3-turn-helix (H3TH) domain n=1 Tax=Cohaesibacter marisflavi TaxID=655353 RepID=A0A1I5E7N4_9HYPH|nr:hypothetical protein [Cohaesibacter marisflavi]SFO07618.1 Predicted 5' DNA nuclease, flap endonuclease-1-like, helix-3-turn-helix (H3TH) domain [Cohaesibacter marisflavi]